MEIVKQQKTIKNRCLVDVCIAGGIFIATGLLIMFRNLGYVDPSIFSMIVSWPSLLIVLGIWSLIHRHFKSGIIFMSIGGFFLIPHITGAGAGWIQTYWPFVFVIIGVSLIIHHLLPRRWKHRADHWRVDTNYQLNEGYVTSDNSFGNLRHIVLEDVFKGARIQNNFGATMLDLRGTTLEPGATIIDLDSSFGGIEIYVPHNWMVITELDCSMAGVEDKRNCIVGVQPELKLYIRGKISFSGVEIKN